MGCGQSVAASAGPIYEMTFDMLPNGTPAFTSDGLIDDDHSAMLNMVEGMDGTPCIPARLVMITAVPDHVTSH